MDILPLSEDSRYLSGHNGWMEAICMSFAACLLMMPRPETFTFCEVFIILGYLVSVTL